MSKSSSEDYTIASYLALEAVDFAARHGLDRTVLLQRVEANRPGFGSPDVRVAHDVQLGIWADVVRHLNDPGAYFASIRERKMEQYGLFGFAVITSTSGRECFERAIRFIHLVDGYARLAMREDQDYVRVRLETPPADSVERRLGHEIAIASFVQGIRDTVGTSIPLTGVRFRHKAPADTSAHRRFFACPVSFSAEHDEFWLPQMVLHVVPRTANSAMSRYFHDHASQLLENLPQGDAATADTVRSAIARELPSGEPSMQLVAKRLGKSDRTLRRDLKAEGVTFRQLVDQVRCTRAKELLASPQASLAEVAYVLGFSEVSAMSRAFKRWAGMGPGEYRASFPRAARGQKASPMVK